MASISIALGNVTITQDAESLKDAIRKAVFLQSIPTKCPKCGAGLQFNNYKAKGTKENNKNKEYEYFGVKCTGNPQHSLNFHEYAETQKGFYIKQDEDEWTTYAPKAGGGGNGQPGNFDDQARALVSKITQDTKEKGLYHCGAFNIKVWTEGEEPNKKKFRSCDCRDFIQNPQTECVHLRALWFKYAPEAQKQQ